MNKLDSAEALSDVVENGLIELQEALDGLPDTLPGLVTVANSLSKSVGKLDKLLSEIPAAELPTVDKPEAADDTVNIEDLTYILEWVQARYPKVGGPN